MKEEMIEMREIRYDNGTIRKQVLIEGVWEDLYVQENAVAPLSWANVEWVKEKFYMPYEEAKKIYGSLPSFPKKDKH